MKYRLRLSCHTDKTETVTPDDMGYSNEEWEELSESEKDDQIRRYIDDMPDQPYWDIDSQEELP